MRGDHELPVPDWRRCHVVAKHFATIRGSWKRSQYFEPRRCRGFTEGVACLHRVVADEAEA